VRRRLALLMVSAALLTILWRQVGWREVAAGILGLDYRWLAAAMALFVPIVGVAGWRWDRLTHAPGEGHLGYSIQLVLAASALNIILPSKLGDVAKGLFAERNGRPGGAEHGLALAIFEKGVDTASLAFWMVVASLWVRPAEPLGWGMVAIGVAIVIAVGLLVALGRETASAAPARAGLSRAAGLLRRIAAVGGELRQEPRRLAAVLGMSLLLWFVHLAQFGLVQAATGGEARPLLVASRVGMAIFVGFLPVSFAGVGTRDAAMVYLLAAPLGESAALVLGLFATLRYVVVALAGIPYISHLDFARLRRAQQESNAVPGAVSVATDDTLPEPREKTREVDR